MKQKDLFVSDFDLLFNQFLKKDNSLLRLINFEELKDTQVEQVSLIVGEHYVISFQERKGDIFELIRERIRSGKGRIRSMGSDYLAYVLLDAVVDHYFIILERIGERLEELEDKVVTDPRPGKRGLFAHSRKNSDIPPQYL